MGYLAFVQTVKSTANQNLTTLGGLDWRHWNGFSQNSSTRKTSGAGLSDLSAIGSITTDQTVSARTVTASDPTLSTANSGVFFGANGTTGWGERFTVDIGTTRKKCWILFGQFSSAVKVDISLSDSSASAISYTYAASSIYSTDGLLVEFDLEANSAGQTATVDITCSTNIDFGRIGVQATALSLASSDVTAALTGQAITSAQGSLTDVIDKAITGQAVTASQGTLNNAVSKALTGQSSTVSQGTLSDAVSKALTGQEITTGQGTISADNAVTRALAGQEITSSQGDVSDSVTTSLTGQSASVNQGNLTDTVAYSITGQSASMSQGNLSDVVLVGLSGQEITSAQGDVTSNGDVTRALSGQSIAAQQGSLSIPQENLFGGVAHFAKLSERSRKIRELEAQERTEAPTSEDIEEVVQIPQEVKNVISNVAKIDNEKKQRAQLKAQLKALEIQFKQEYADALKTEMIRTYLIAELERKEEEETIAMMMMALV